VERTQSRAPGGRGLGSGPPHVDAATPPRGRDHPADAAGGLGPLADEYAEETTLIFTRRTPDGWARPAGRLDAATLEPLLIDGATAYVCGSTGFAEHASQLLVSLGAPVGSVRVERYGPTS
jgi:ferredoxin-NADP reductase